MILTLIGLVLFVAVSYFVVASYAKNVSHPDDCVGNWSKWDVCDNPCNHRKSSSRKYIISKPKQSEKGRDCPYPHNHKEYKDCPFTQCPINCEGTWTNWTSCSNDCEQTQQVTREFVVSQSNAHGGRSCPSPLVETSNCPYVSCDRDCVGGFSEWSANCEDLSCGFSNTINRIYTIQSDAVGNGKPCSNNHNFVQESNCPFVECVQPCNGGWSDWGECPTDSCGESNQVSRIYTIDYPSGDCPVDDRKVEYSNCPYTSCPRHCEGGFSDWDVECSNMPCGMSNVRTRVYTITSNAEPGGSNCYHNGRIMEDGQTETQACPFVPCPVDCVGGWTDWEQCDPERACGTPQTMNRTFIITSNAQNGGQECDPNYTKSESSNCPIIECPVHCAGTFGEWDSNCSDMPCGQNNVRRRVFTITSNAEYGGSNCYHNGQIIGDGYVDTQQCQFVNCPQDCVGGWSDWNASCDDLPIGQSNEIYREFHISSNAMYGGVGCSNNNRDKETVQCPFVPEPIHCEGDWIRDGPSCEVQECGNDKYELYVYNITQSNQHGGDVCEADNEAIESNMCAPCDQCQTRWSDWSDCENSESNCDGQRTRHLTIIRQGLECVHIGQVGDIVATETSNCLPCPIDCQGDWVGDESECLEKECGIHHYYKYFEVVDQENQTGNCPNRGRSNLWDCPYFPCQNIDCVGMWSNAPDLCPTECSDEQHLMPQRYHIITPRLNQGSNCPNEEGDIRYEYDNPNGTAEMCVHNPCPVPQDCKGEWSNVLPCDPDRQCNTSNVMIDRYIITQQSANGGNQCLDPVAGATRESNCPIIPCPNVDCEGAWSNVPNLCPTECLRDNESPSLIPQIYNIHVHKEHNGRTCEASNGQIRYTYDYEGPHNTQNYCQQEACPTPIHCEGYFSNITSCSYFDDVYTYSPLNVCNRSNVADYVYVITQESEHGGSNCGHERGTTSNLACERLLCPVPCEGHWSNDTPCPEECSLGIPVVPTYVTTREASNNGQECPHKNGEQGSNMCDLCVRPCEYVIDYFNQCPTECSDPTKDPPKRLGKYVITREAQNGGYCPVSNDQAVETECENVTYCQPTDCVGGWSNTIECPNIDCIQDGYDLPIYKQRYVVQRPATYGGKECQNIGDQRSLDCTNIPYCPVDCVGGWSNIIEETCSDMCYSNDVYNEKIQKPDKIPIRRYHIRNYELHGGNECPNSNLKVETSNCPVNLCPQDCVADWRIIQECPLDCHNEEVNPYQSVSQYFIDQYPNETGEPCVAEHGASNAYDCPTNQCPQREPEIAVSDTRYAVKNCVWGQHNHYGCSAQKDHYPGHDTCYHKINIGLVSVEDDNTTHPSVAVRCFDGKKGSTVPNTHGVTTQAQAKFICETRGQHLPKTIDEVGAACGSGHGYDAHHIWMDESFVPPLTKK